MPKDTLLVEWEPPLRGEIGRDARTLGDAVVHADDSREFLLQALHRSWECVAKAFDDLEQRQVGIAEPTAQEKGAPAAGDHAFEILQEFRQAGFVEIRRALLRFLALVFVIEPGSDRVVCVMDLDHEIGDREL